MMIGGRGSRTCCSGSITTNSPWAWTIAGASSNINANNVTPIARLDLLDMTLLLWVRYPARTVFDQRNYKPAWPRKEPDYSILVYTCQTCAERSKSSPRPGKTGAIMAPVPRAFDLSGKLDKIKRGLF